MSWSLRCTGCLGMPGPVSPNHGVAPRQIPALLLGSLLLALLGTAGLVGCSEKREPLDSIDGMFYFTSEVEFRGFDDQGAHLGPPTNGTVWLIPPNEMAANYYAKEKYRLFVRSEVSGIQAGAVYSVAGVDLGRRMRQSQTATLTLEDCTRFVRIAWPDVSSGESRELADSVRQWASRHSGERLFLVTSYAIATPAAAEKR